VTADSATPYFLTGPWHEVAYLDAEEFPTVVNIAHDHPMTEMAPLFDATFEAIFPMLGTQGLRPVGPPFSLHHRMPTDTVDFEVGIAVDQPLPEAQGTEGGMTLTPSVLPAGRIAVLSHIGPYEELAEAWSGFMDEVVAAGHEPDFPFWEVYVSNPRPDLDPATLRTDLVIRLRD